MMIFQHIWGLKTTAAFDVWSFEHILSGLSIGHLVTSNNIRIFKKIGVDIEKVTTSHFDIVGVLFVAYFWEAIEHYLETGLAGSAVQYWFQGVEYWPNRLITDPLMLVLGYLIVTRFPKLVNWARGGSAIWLYVNVFVFPNSMYLQELLSKIKF